MAAIFNSSANPALPQVASIEQAAAERYRLLNVVNRGSYGVVYRAWDKKTGQVVAMKHELHGISLSTAREISILGSLPPHPSVVGFKKVVVDAKRRVLVVMEYLPTDLHRLIREKRRDMMGLTASEVKRMMRQIVEGVAFLHEKGVMHRDLKPANILVNSSQGQCKICDFGMSRRVSSGGSYNARVGTQWYKAPELLLGANRYTPAIDMWSVGCIMGELLLGQVLFPGNSEFPQMMCIFQKLRNLREKVGGGGGRGYRFGGRGGMVISGSGVELLLRLLEVDGEKRISAKDALNHPWFKEFYGLQLHDN